MNKTTSCFLGAGSVLGLLFGGGLANAAGTIGLTGTVPIVCTLTANTAAGATGIALQTNAIALAIGSVDETCNDDAGYTVGMTSANGITSGMFKTGPGDATHQLIYTVKYDGVAVTPIAGFVAVTDVTARVAGSGTVNKAITIGFAAAGASLIPASTYSDTLTFTMTAK